MTTKSQGFNNLLRRENKAWWGGKRWIIQLGLGLLICGASALAMVAIPPVAALQGEIIDPLEIGVQLFFGMGFLFMAIDVIILMQDAVIGEKQSGITEWVLSKPVARSSYILSKLLSNGVGIIVLLIIFPGVVSFLLLRSLEAAVTI